MIQDLEEKLAAKAKAHDKGCKTIQHLLIKVRDLDDEISRLKVEVSEHIVFIYSFAAVCCSGGIKIKLF